MLQVGQQTQDQNRANVSVQKQEKTDIPAQGIQTEGNPLYLGESLPFVLFRPSTDWIRPTTLERSICFTQPIDLNVKLTENLPHSNTQNNV